MQQNMTPTLNQISEVLPELPNAPSDNFYEAGKEGGSQDFPLDFSTLYSCLQPQLSQMQALQFGYSSMLASYWQWDLQMFLQPPLADLSIGYKGQTPDSR